MKVVYAMILGRMMRCEVVTPKIPLNGRDATPADNGAKEVLGAMASNCMSEGQACAIAKTGAANAPTSA